MSKKPSLTDPIAEGSYISYDYPTTEKAIIDDLVKLFAFDPKARTIKGLPKYVIKPGSNAEAPLLKFLGKLKEFVEQKDKNKVAFSTVIVALEAIPAQAQKDAYFGVNELTQFINERFLDRISRGVLIHAWAYRSHEYSKVAEENARYKSSEDIKKQQDTERENKELKGKLELIERSRARVMEERDTLEASFAAWQDQSLSESMIKAEKGTYGHELEKLEDLVSKYRLISITRLQLAQAKIDSIKVAGFLADIQFNLLKDIRHHSGSGLFLGAIASRLEYGKLMLQNDFKDNAAHQEIIMKLIDQLRVKDIDNTINLPIKELFDQAKAKSTDSTLHSALDNVLAEWNKRISGIDTFSPQDIQFLISTINVAIRASSSNKQVETVPAHLEFDPKAANPRTFWIYLFKVVAQIRLIYKENTFFEIPGKPQFNDLRAYCLEYFENLISCMREADKVLKESDHKVELCKLKTYHEDYKDIIGDVYDKLWEKKLSNLNTSNTSLGNISVAFAPREVANKKTFKKVQVRRPAASTKPTGTGAGVVLNKKDTNVVSSDQGPEASVTKPVPVDSGAVENSDKSKTVVSEPTPVALAPTEKEVASDGATDVNSMFY